jgi:tripartite-type tricarboxylate transporter receptor subunit TctC
MSMNRRLVLQHLAATAATASGIYGAPTGAFAQQYPDKPVRIIVPFAAGGSLDGAPRVVSLHISSVLGWSIVIDNRVGGGGLIGTLAGKQAAPDGYTLTAINGVTHGSSLAIKSDVGYDPIADFAPIVLIGDAPLALLVRSDIPARTLVEFLDLLKKNPDKYNYGSGGFGTQHHLAVAMMLHQAGLPLNIAAHVPAQGLALAINDLLTGSTQFIISSIGPAWQFVDEGKLRPLAITSAKRLERLPKMPTMAELGFRDFVMLAWSGLAAPAGTPQPILARWNAAVNDALADPNVRKQLAGFDLDARGGTQAEFADFLKREMASYRKLGASAGFLAAK